jgi:mRNA interferase MazF
MSQPIRRGDVFWANLDPTIGVEIQKTRPVIVASNDAINQYSRDVVLIPIPFTSVESGALQGWIYPNCVGF